MSENKIHDYLYCTSEYSVGAAEHDEDHQTLFELLNHLRAVIKTKESPALNLVTDDIQQYAIYHFRREEELMQAARYHRLINRMLQTSLEDFRNNSGFNDSLEAVAWFVGSYEN